MTTIVFADVETTGTDPARHHVWEIGLVIRKPGEQDAEYCWQLNPDLSTADAAALRIGRYYQRNRLVGEPGMTDEVKTIVHPGDGLVEGDRPVGRVEYTAGLAADLAKLLDGVVLVAANVAFDAAFLEAFLRAHRQAPAWNYHLVEIESMAAGALGVLPPWKLDQFLAACDIKVSDDKRHTALGDALAVRDLYDAVAGRSA